MNLIPWRRKQEPNRHEIEPESSLARLRGEIDTLLGRFFGDPWGFAGFGSPWTQLAAAPRTDLADTDKDVTVTMELPGVDPQDVEIHINGDLLTVRGEKKAEREEKKKDYHYVERQFGSFCRTVQVPSTADPDKVDAAYKDGVLTITIAKHPDAKPKRITVRNA